MKNNNQHPSKNEDPSNSSSSKERAVDENGKRISWNDPEISEADNTERRSPEVINQEEKPEQPGDRTHEKEIPNDPSIIDLYDKDPNAATVHSSNADSTFGNEHKNQSMTEDQGDSENEDKKYPNSDEIDNSENEKIEGDNES